VIELGNAGERSEELLRHSQDGNRIFPAAAIVYIVTTRRVTTACLSVPLAVA
jgi:hypothetical protein